VSRFPASDLPAAPFWEQDGFRFRAYLTNEPWKASTVRRFDTADGVATIYVMREELPPNETLSSHAMKKVLSVSGAPSFGLKEMKETEIGGVRALRLRFAWKAGEDTFEQMLVWLLTRDGGLVAVSLTLALACELERHKALVTNFERLVASVELAGSPSLGPRPPTPPRDDPPAVTGFVPIPSGGTPREPR